MSDRDKMLQVQQLIKEGRYVEARDVLSAIDHPKAREWEQKLDELGNGIRKTKPRPLFSRVFTFLAHLWKKDPRYQGCIVGCVLLIIGSCGLLIWALGVEVGVFPDVNATQTAEAQIKATDRAVTTLSSPITLTAGNYRLEITRVFDASKADGKKSKRGLFLILDIILYNDSSSETCFHDDDFQAKAGDKAYSPDNLSDVRDEFFPGRDYPGGFKGHCVAKHSSEASLIEFDVPVDLTNFTLKFTPKDEEAELIVWLERQGGDEHLAVAQAFTATPTSTPSPTFTPPPTSTYLPSFTPTNTPPITLTVALVFSTPEPAKPTISSPSTQTWYVTNAQQVNIRSCASPDCSIMDTVSYGQAISVVLPISGTWQSVLLPDGRSGYINVGYITSAIPLRASPTLPQQQPSQSDLEKKARKVADRTLRDVESVQVFNDSLGAVVIVEYAISEFADLDLANWEIVEAICEFRKSGFDSYGFRFAGKVDVVDSYGAVSTITGLVVVIEPDTATRINCENTALVDLEAIADQYDAHPVMR